MTNTVKLSLKYFSFDRQKKEKDFRKTSTEIPWLKRLDKERQWGDSLSLFDLLSISSLILPISGVKREWEREKDLAVSRFPGVCFWYFVWWTPVCAFSAPRRFVYSESFCGAMGGRVSSIICTRLQMRFSKNQKIRKEKVVNYHNIVGMMMRVTRITFLCVSVLFSFSRQVWAIKS